MTRRVTLNRVVVTGLGALTPLGSSVTETWSNIVEGRSGIRSCERFSGKGFSTDFAAEVVSVDWKEHFSDRRLRRLDPCHRLAIVAARQAIKDAAISPSQIDPIRAGLFVGTSLGGMASGMAYHRQRLRGGKSRRAQIVRYPFHVLVDEISRETKFYGPRSVISTACTASTLALVEAVDAVRNGEVSVALAGGVDPLSDFTFAGFNAMQNMAAQPCAPFSQSIGLSLGEAAAFIVLEPFSEARDRGARIYAEILGDAMNVDAYHPTAPDPSGRSQVRLLLDAFENSGIAPGDVDYLNAHGTGTASNDVVECRALNLVFGRGLQTLPISSIKGAIGHTLGCAGAIEAICTIKAVQDDIAPPTVNYTSARTGCEMDFVPNRGRKIPIQIAVTQNFAFGGNNAAIVITKPSGRATCEAVDHDVVVTGFGILSPLGNGRIAFLEGLLSAETGIRETTSFDTRELRSKLTGTLCDFDPKNYTHADVRRMDRLSQFIVAGSEMALQDANLRVSRDNAMRIGLVIGTTGPTSSCVAFHRDLAYDHPQLANPKIFPNTVFNAGLGHAAVNLHIKGCNIATTLGQASGVQAISHAYRLLRRGRADVIVAGGADELLYDAMEGCAVGRLLSPNSFGNSAEEAMRPFDRRRNGTILGEGAGLLVLETREHAEMRGAHILAQIKGAAAGAFAPTACAHEASHQIADIFKLALRRANTAQAEVDYVAAGALGLRDLDSFEAGAIIQTFAGKHPSVAALNSLFGSSAAGTSLAACATILGMLNEFQPAGVGSDEPEWNLALINGEPLCRAFSVAMVNGLAFGGSVVTLVVHKALA